MQDECAKKRKETVRVQDYESFPFEGSNRYLSNVDVQALEKNNRNKIK